jgi:hypothetical protein
MKADFANSFLTAMFAPYQGANDLRLEVRPLWPAWMQAILYPEGGAPYYWASHTGWREWFVLNETGICGAVRHALRLSEKFETYFGVLPRVGRRGTKEDVRAAGWLWADVDGGDGEVDGALDLVGRSALPAPHIRVVSGGGLHCYFRLSEVVRLDDAEERRRFKELLKRLCRAIGGTSPAPHADSSRADTASILRVPGTLNNKRQTEPRPVTLLHFDLDAEAKSFAWWGANLPALPAPPAKPLAVNASPMAQAEGLLKWARTPYPEGKRHKDLASAAAWLVRTVGLPKPQAEELLLIKAQASPGMRTITPDEVRGIVQWA